MLKDKQYILDPVISLVDVTIGFALNNKAILNK